MEVETRGFKYKQRENYRGGTMTFKVLIDIVRDIEEFIEKLEKRRGELEELKDELLIYSDEEFMESIKRGLKDLEEGRFKRCESLEDIDELFEEL